MDNIDYNDIDEGIRNVVRLLVSHGINTFSSCEGGSNHSFAMPTVRFYSNTGDMDKDRFSVAEILSSNGYENFQIKHIYTYQANGKKYRDTSQDFLELEFWFWDYETNSSKMSE